MWWMVTDNAWLAFSLPPYLVQKRVLEHERRDSAGYPAGSLVWGPWRPVAEFYDKTRAERVTNVLSECVSLTNTPPYWTRRADREYRMVTR
jgi:hypothetical protein